MRERKERRESWGPGRLGKAWGLALVLSCDEESGFDSEGSAKL